MNINMNDVFDFYENRIKCHVESVNYFAGLLGYHFPEHDSDKVIEPIRTGYAYVFYNTYHKNFHLTDDMSALCKDAHDTHHKHASHHIEAYKNVKEIPDVCLYEIVSDWASANFEQMNIIHDKEAVSLQTWFNRNISQLGWNKHQMDIIQKSFAVFDQKTDANKVKAIWQPLLEHADL